LQQTPSAQQQPAEHKSNTVGAKVDPATGRRYVEVETIRDGETAKIRVDAQEQVPPVGVNPIPWPSGHSPLENAGGVNAFRMSQGMGNSSSGSVSTSSAGSLQLAIQHFSR
jgi:hypothetical protein